MYLGVIFLNHSSYLVNGFLFLKLYVHGEFKKHFSHWVFKD